MELKPSVDNAQIALSQEKNSHEAQPTSHVGLTTLGLVSSSEPHLKGDNATKEHREIVHTAPKPKAEVEIRDKSSPQERVPYYLAQLKNSGAIEDSTTVENLVNLATAWQELWNFKQARIAYEKAIAMARKVYATDPLKLARCLHLFAEFLCVFADAVPTGIQYHEEILRLRLKMHGEDHLDVVRSHYAIANVYTWTQQWEKCKESAEKALKLVRPLLSKDDLFVAEILFTLGIACDSLENLEEAAKSYEEGIEIITHLQGETKDTVVFLTALGSCYSSLGEKQKAEETWKRALQIGQQLDEEHPQIMQIKHLLKEV